MGCSSTKYDLRRTTFDPIADAREVRKCIKGAGTDEVILVHILGNRSRAETAEIAKAYEKEFNSPLAKDLASDTSGNLRRALIARVTDLSEYRAKRIRDAIVGAGTNEAVLIDVLSQCTNQEINDTKTAYERLYGRNKEQASASEGNTTQTPVPGTSQLEKDIVGDTSFNFRKVLLALCKAQRDDPTAAVSESTATVDAETLFKAGEAKFGTDDDVFVSIISKRSPAHMQLVDKVYRQKHGHGLEDAIERETSGYYKRLLLALIKLPEVYWAERIHEAVAGAGTDDAALIYAIAIHDKPMLKKIATEYVQLYKKNMEEDIENDTSGDYRRLLSTLLR